MSVTKSEWFRPSSNGASQIFSRSWIGEAPKAVLVIAHGMAEHSGRYDDFASFLAENGYAVYMNDHLGHGRSSQLDGHFADEGGWEFVLKDLDSLMDLAAQANPGLPLLLMGHSMGSFLARGYLSRWGQRLSGCIICGTMGSNPALKAAKAIADLQCKVRGPRSKGKLLNKLSSGSYLNGIDNPVNEFAWLSRDDEVCKKYAADKMCGFPFTAGGYRDMFGGILEISEPRWAESVPKNVPLFVISGDKDPVGANGQGPAEVAEWLKAAGVEQVELKLYEGMRHEIHNEIGKESVYQDILNWLNARTEANP